jgi:hypothetical protein
LPCLSSLVDTNLCAALDGPSNIQQPRQGRPKVLEVSSEQQ